MELPGEPLGWRALHGRDDRQRPRTTSGRRRTPTIRRRADFQKRYPNALNRDFDGKPKALTEADALIAYLQMLGTLVDFKLYDGKANLR